jgi:hypothetical protein
MSPSGSTCLFWLTYAMFLDAPHSVESLWTSDQPVAETSTWQHTTLTTDKHPCDHWDRLRDGIRIFFSHQAWSCAERLWGHTSPACSSKHWPWPTSAIKPPWQTYVLWTLWLASTNVCDKEIRLQGQCMGAGSSNLFVEWTKMLDHRKSTSSWNDEAKRLSDPRNQLKCTKWCQFLRSVLH